MTGSSARSTDRDLVTGATGLLGSHIAERLVARGRRVRALVRAASDTGFLQSLGVELVRGDLTDPESTRRAIRGVEVVYHAAAKVGDWGTWPEFQAGCHRRDRATSAGRRPTRGSRGSSTSARPAPTGIPPEGGPPVDETAPLGQNLWWPWDYYTISKVEAERIFWRLAEERGLALTVIRPSWLYGERDRTTTARLVESLRRRRVPPGRPGDNPLSAVYAGTVADAAILAARRPGLGRRGVQHHQPRPDHPARVPGPVRRGQRRPADRPERPLPASSSPPPPRSRPTAACPVAGAPPLITRYATWLLGRDLEYSTEKARDPPRLDPLPSYRESIERTVRWYLRQPPAAPPPVARTA